MYSNRTLWILQIAFGVYFVVTGVMHFALPEGLPGPMEWMYDLSDRLHLFSGTAEILGGLGLILPGLTKIQPKLTVLAAEGLILVMIGAAIWHGGRGEVSNIVQNILIAAFMAWIAYGRAKKTPLSA
jgi:uncharacterized membrane protein